MDDEWVWLQTYADPPHYIKVLRSEVDIWISYSDFHAGPTWQELV